MNSKFEIRGHVRAIVGTLLLASATIVAVGAEPNAVTPQAAATLASFAGNWQVTVFGQTGCGIGTTVYQATIATTGQGTATGRSHTAGCGDAVITTPVSFNINSVSANGSGMGGISCGAGCGWVIKVQISRNHQIFNLIDVDPTNPNNFIEGTAVKQ